MKAYQAAYHQMKFICLIALTLVHAISWVNQIQRIPLETLPGFHALRIFTSFNLFFSLLAGASLCMQLQSQNQIRENRLTSAFPTEIYSYLVGLILIHGLIDVLSYRTLAAFFYWNFFKTLWIAFLLIWGLGRLHFAWLFTGALAINALSELLKVFLASFIHHAATNPVRENLFLYRLWISLALVGVTFFTFRKLHLRLPEMPIKKILLGFLLLGCSLAIGWTLHENPTRHNFQVVVNWWIDAWAGNSDFPNFYVLSAWVSPVIYGFIGTHLLLRARSHYERFPSLITASSVLVTIALLLWATAVRPEEYTNIISLWDFKSFQTMHWEVQPLGVAGGLSLFLILLRINSWIPALSRLAIAEKWSVASFGFYLTVILVARPLARVLSGLSLVPASLLTFFLSLVCGALVAEALSFLNRKKIRLILTKTPS